MLGKVLGTLPEVEIVQCLNGKNKMAAILCITIITICMPNRLNTGFQNIWYYNGIIIPTFGIIMYAIVP